MKDDIFYISRVYLKKEYTRKIIYGPLSPRDITVDMLHEINHSKFNKSDTVIFKKRTAINRVAVWECTLVKGDENVHPIFEIVP